jgi:ankyrin repeat protein
MRSKLLIRTGAAIVLAAGLCRAATDSSLIDAIKRRDTKAADALIARRTNIDAALPDGATALAWAVFLDLQDTALKLIDAGANVNTAGDYGETPLTLALANGNAVLSAHLLKAGANPKAQRWNGETTLMIAAGAGSVEEVKLLLDAGLDVNAQESEKGQNALMWAAAEGHPDVVDLLIQHGANVNASSKKGFTPLIFASMKNDSASIRLLIKAGADPNYPLLRIRIKPRCWLWRALITARRPRSRCSMEERILMLPITVGTHRCTWRRRPAIWIWSRS